MRNRPSPFAIALAWLVGAGVSVQAHDIPNQRVDRSIQVVLAPGRLEIEYEVGLTELTLTQDLRALTTPQPGADRSEWLKLYGEVVGPLDARGFLVSVDGSPIEVHPAGYRLSVEEHPRYTFRFTATIPSAGRLVLRDTNYLSSEGTSRLAVRARDGLELEGYHGPAHVEQVAIRPVWELSDLEERATKELEVRYQAPVSTALSTPKPEPEPEPILAPKPQASTLSALLDRGSRLSWFVLAMIAMGLGASHAIQPGHGKTLVTAAAIRPGARFYHPALLGLSTTVAHVGSVLLIAAALWSTGTSRVESIHLGLARSAGFLIGATGFWRLGRHLGGHGEHEAETVEMTGRGALGLIGLGLAGGIVPCWDAVGLLVMSAALGRLQAGVGLVLAFSAGMAAVLVVVGMLAWKLRARVVGRDVDRRWQRRLGIATGGLLAGLGVLLFVQ